MLRGEAIRLYRGIQRTIQQLPDKAQREELRVWARSEFETHRNQQDEVNHFSIHIILFTW